MRKGEASGIGQNSTEMTAPKPRLKNREKAPEEIAVPELDEARRQ
jgi:hypothetical protein